MHCRLPYLPDPPGLLLCLKVHRKEKGKIVGWISYSARLITYVPVACSLSFPPASVGSDAITKMNACLCE